jgi:putative aldouronate transport system permease protein
MKHSKIRRKQQDIGSILFDIFIRVFFAIYVLSILWVFWQLIVAAISPEIENNSVQIRLWPRHVTFGAFSEIWKRAGLGSAFMVNIYITLLGTAAHVLICTMAGYALSKPKFPFKNAFLTIILISMLIPGQLTMVPTFMLYRSLGLINNINALVVSGMVSGFSIIVMRNYFLGIPISLGESAKIDGASELSIFFRIYVPISIPGFATIIMLQMIGKWNTFFEAVLFINSSDMQPLQTKLNMIVNSITSMAQIGQASQVDLFGQNVTNAAIIIAALPIIIAYPFMQKYLVKGMLVGAVKG